MRALSRALLLLMVLTVPVSQGIVIRHDTVSTAYEVSRSAYPAVFFLERQGSRKVCVATVIHGRWALTAAHCGEETMLGNTLENGRRFAVTVAGQQREIDLMIAHPQYDQSSASDVDLALLRFREPARVPRPVPLQLRADELGAQVSLVGWGYSGLGTTGRQYDDGRMRRAQNRIVEAERRLRMVFDDPRQRGSEALALEGTPSLGDSGGPAFIETDSGYRLAGITVGEVKGSDFSEETQGRYGAVAIYERISRHIDWIETVVGERVPFGS